VARSPLILLPPSEGKAPGGRAGPWAGCQSSPELDDSRREVMKDLDRAMRGSAASRQKLLGVGKAAADAATEANRSVAESPTLPAIERYTGVLYDALDASSLNATASRRLDARVRILSGLWGVVSPSDLIPDYKLKMGSSLPRLGKLSTWWRGRLTPALDDAARRRVIWDLRPNEHAAAWRVGETPSHLIMVEFLEERPGRGLVTVSHWNKLLKGLLTRHLVSVGSPSVETLADFEFDGFVWEPDSTKTDGGVTTTSVVRRLN